MRVLNKRTDKISTDAVYIGRPSKWGNPARIGAGVPRSVAIDLFRAYAVDKLKKELHWLDELRGKDLVCWCSPLPCHAEVIIELLGEG